MLTQHRYITVLTPSDYLRFIEDMVCDYYDTPEYTGTLFVLNTTVLDKGVDFSKYTRKIFYNLEHSYLYGKGLYRFIDGWWCPGGVGWRWCEHFDEIWDFLYENRQYYPDNLKDKFRFMPIRYSPTYAHRGESSPRRSVDIPSYEWFFSGCFFEAPERLAMSALMMNVGNSILMVNGMSALEAKPLASKARFIMDYPHYSVIHNAQNTVRIGEFLTLGLPVVSFFNKSGKEPLYDYFQGIVNLYDFGEPGAVEYYQQVPVLSCRRLKEMTEFFSSDGIAMRDKYITATSSEDAYEEYRRSVEKQKK